MPKRRKDTRKAVETLEVPALPPTLGPGQRIGALLVVQGAEADLGRHIVCVESVTIGRDDGVVLPLHDGSISRVHCRVEHTDDGGHILVDLGSTNGTLVNAHRVIDRYPLASGDKIVLGSTVLSFTLSDAVDLEYQSRVRELIDTDPLTGLLARRQYDALFANLVERADAEDRMLTVMVIDMDGLKAINDTHGHEMGSFAIAEVAAILRDVLAPAGELCRFGGDEFVACFLDLDGRRAVALADEACRRVAAAMYIRDGVGIQPTVSIGVAVYPEDTEDPLTLFNAADAALYGAKRAGRNRVARVDPDDDGKGAAS